MRLVLGLLLATITTTAVQAEQSAFLPNAGIEQNTHLLKDGVTADVYSALRMRPGDELCHLYRDRRRCEAFRCHWQEEGCAVGASTPRGIAPFCHLYNRRDKCRNFQCEWKYQGCTVP